MDVVPIVDVLVVDNGGCNAAESVAALHVFEETTLKLFGIAVDDPVGVLAEDLQLALVRLAHAVALEAVLVVAHLAVPPELLENFRLDAVSDGFRRQEVALPHRRSDLVRVPGKS